VNKLGIKKKREPVQKGWRWSQENKMKPELVGGEAFQQTPTYLSGSEGVQLWGGGSLQEKGNRDRKRRQLGGFGQGQSKGKGTHLWFIKEYQRKNIQRKDEQLDRGGRTNRCVWGGFQGKGSGP